MLLEIRIGLFGLLKTCIVLDLALGSNLLRSCRLVERNEFVVGKLDDAELPYLSICGFAVWAHFALPALRINLFQDDCAPKVVEAWSSQLLHEVSTLFFCQKDTGACLAYLLEDRHGEAQITDVERG